MKQFILTGITLLFCISVNAQDTIVKRNGDIQLSKILEISATEVKYKKFDFPDGPDFIDSKSNIKLIKYSNGSKEEFGDQAPINKSIQKENNTDYYTGPVNPTNKIESHGTRFRYKGNRINEREMQNILLNNNDPQITLLVDQARHYKKSQYIGLGGLAFGAVGVGAVLIGGLAEITGESGDVFYITGGICFAAAIPFPIASFVFKNKRNVSNREAIKLYNAKF